MEQSCKALTPRWSCSTGWCTQSGNCDECSCAQVTATQKLINRYITISWPFRFLQLETLKTVLSHVPSSSSVITISCDSSSVSGGLLTAQVRQSTLSRGDAADQTPVRTMCKSIPSIKSNLRGNSQCLVKIKAWKTAAWSSQMFTAGAGYDNHC